MSEPLSSTEIEDVLSSIRRLVSDDLRPLHRSTLQTAAPVAADKLILTPALRVVQDMQQSAPPAFAPPAPATPAPATPYRLHLGIPAPVEPAGLNQIVAAVGAAVDAQPSEWEAEIGDAAPVAAGPGQDGWLSDEADAPYYDASLAIVDDEADRFGTDDPDVEERLPQHDPVAALPGWAQDDPDLSHITIKTVGAETSAGAPGTIEPDADWADAAEASVIASLAADDAGDYTAAAAYDDDPMLFDEEVLRELVRDILREELAGRMGERITRNIRKLVRAEIARSFAAQEFE